MKIFRWQLLALALILYVAAAWAGKGKDVKPLSPDGQSQASATASPEPVARVAQPLTGTPDSRARACQVALKQIATRLEMYATDHNGHYPARLTELVPTYLDKMPECPTAGKDTYSAGYTVGRAAPHNDQDWEDFYHVACAGHYHEEAGLGPDMPACNARLGLMPDMPFNGTPQQARKACQENLKTIATTMEMYAADHNGHYPKTLAELGATYLSAVPRCPATGKDTYSANLKVGRSAPHNPNDYVDYFYLECSGSHAGAQPASGPCYDSVRGLSDK